MNEIFLVLVSYVIILTFLAIEICLFFAAGNRYVYMNTEKRKDLSFFLLKTNALQPTTNEAWDKKKNNVTLEDNDLNRKKQIIYSSCSIFFSSFVYLFSSNGLFKLLCLQCFVHPFEIEYKMVVNFLRHLTNSYRLYWRIMWIWLR